MSGDFMNQSNLLEAWEALTQLDFWLDINLWSCPNNGTADIRLPRATHWLEVNTGRVSQGAGGIFGAGPALRGADGRCASTTRLAVVCLYKAMGVPWNDRDPEYDEWLQPRLPRLHAGRRYRWATRSRSTACSKDATDWWKTEEYPDGPDFPQYAAKFQEEGWFDCRKWHPERWGTYRRWEMGYRRQQGGYNLYAAVDEKCAFVHPHWQGGDLVHHLRVLHRRHGERVLRAGDAGHLRPRRGRRPRTSRTCARRIATPMPATFRTSTSSRTGCEPKNSPRAGARVVRRQPRGRRILQQRQLPEQALPRHRRRGHGPGDRQRRYRQPRGLQAGREGAPGRRPSSCTSGARQPVYFHSEHRQLPWCRELWPVPALGDEPERRGAPRHRAGRLDLDRARPWGAIREVADLYYGIKEGHHQREPRLVVPRDGPRRATASSSSASTAPMDKYAPVLDLRRRPSCAATRWSSTRPPRRTRRSATRCRATRGATRRSPTPDDPRLKEWLANDPRLDDSKVELTYASADAKGLQTISLIKE